MTLVIRLSSFSLFLIFSEIFSITSASIDFHGFFRQLCFVGSALLCLVAFRRPFFAAAATSFPHHSSRLRKSKQLQAGKLQSSALTRPIGPQFKLPGLLIAGTWQCFTPNEHNYVLTGCWLLVTVFQAIELCKKSIRQPIFHLIFPLFFLLCAFVPLFPLCCHRQTLTALFLRLSQVCCDSVTQSFP